MTNQTLISLIHEACHFGFVYPCSIAAYVLTAWCTIRLCSPQIAVYEASRWKLLASVRGLPALPVVLPLSALSALCQATLVDSLVLSLS
jgi:hypothetical protein